MELKCSCGAIIPDSEIDEWNKTNEEGEEYGEVTASCSGCKYYWEIQAWGHWDDFEHAKQYLHDYINPA